MALSTGTGSKPTIPLRSSQLIGRRSSATIAMSESPPTARDENSKLKIGSPVIVVDAPAMLKTANSISCLLVNSGLVKPGDVGRIVARKPKDVWAVRPAIGTYLIDGKHFKPLDVDE